MTDQMSGRTCCIAECLPLAQSGRPGALNQPKVDMSGSGLLLCKLTPEPHSAGRKSLM
jgi:hypothetical protein